MYLISVYKIFMCIEERQIDINYTNKYIFIFILTENNK